MAGESGPASILALALNGDGTAYCLSPWRRAGTFKVEMETLPGGRIPSALARVASGGELSRAMLTLKAILAKVDQVPTLVFDEIDAGI